MVQPLWKTVWRFLKKLEIELPYDPEFSLPGIYLEKIKTLIRKDTLTPMFIAALFTIAKVWKQLKCPLIEMRCVGVCMYVYIYAYIYIIKYIKEYYSAIKKNEILPFAATWMELENIMHSEISQTEKDNAI